MEHATDILNLLAQPNSALEQLLETVAENTDFTIDEATAKEKQASANNTVNKILGKNVDMRAEELIAFRTTFGPINKLVNGSNSKAPAYEAIQKQLLDLFNYLNGIESSPNPQEASFIAAKERFTGQGNSSISQLLVLARNAPQPVKNWLISIADQSWGIILANATQYVNKEWKSQVLPYYKRAIAGRYPITRNSNEAITLGDFTKFFAPQGIMDKFFQEYMVPFVNTSSSPWSWRRLNNHTIDISNANLRQFQRAYMITQMFFPNGSNQLDVTFGLKPTNLDANVKLFQLDFGNKTVEYEHGPERFTYLKWPEANLNDQVRIEFTDLSNGRVSSTKQGPWAWFKTLDNSQLTSTRSATDFKLTFKVKGRTAKYLLRANQATNPFKLSAVRQFKAPSTLG